MKYFQITVYLEEVTKTTDHTGTHKLKKYSENYLVKTERGGEDAVNYVLEKFQENPVWTSKEPAYTLDTYNEDARFYKKEITQIKELPISGDMTV